MNVFSFLSIFQPEQIACTAFRFEQNDASNSSIYTKVSHFISHFAFWFFLIRILIPGDFKPIRPISFVLFFLNKDFKLITTFQINSRTKRGQDIREREHDKSNTILLLNLL